MPSTLTAVFARLHSSAAVRTLAGGIAAAHRAPQMLPAPQQRSLSSAVLAAIPALHQPDARSVDADVSGGALRQLREGLPEDAGRPSAAEPDKRSWQNIRDAALPDRAHGGRRQPHLRPPDLQASQRQNSPPRKKARCTVQLSLDGSRAASATASSRSDTRGSAVPLGQAGTTDLGRSAVVAFHPDAWPAAEAARLLQALRGEVAWEARKVRVMGRVVDQPRLIAYMADDPAIKYTYSGLTLVPEPWSPAVAEIKAKLEELSDSRFDSCLLNLYRDGGDNMGWHSDNEKLYGRNPVIASASFGARRDFMLRCNDDKARKLRFPLGAGDVLVMSGTTQDHWMHNLPKRAGVAEPRINLTFRKVVHTEAR